MGVVAEKVDSDMFGDDGDLVEAEPDFDNFSSSQLQDMMNADMNEGVPSPFGGTVNHRANSSISAMRPPYYY